MRMVKEQSIPARPVSWPRQVLVAAVIAALALGVAGGIAYLRHSPAPGPAGRQTGLTPAEEAAQLAVLEARPLIIPPMPADGSCPVTTRTLISPFADPSHRVAVFSARHLYGEGGPETDSASGAKTFDLTAFTDPTVHGVVLLRAEELGGGIKVFFAGPYAAGPVVGTDTIGGQLTDLHGELALPSARQPANTRGMKPGWAVWHFRDGVAAISNACYGFQFDTLAGTEFFVGQ